MSATAVNIHKARQPLSFTSAALTHLKHCCQQQPNKILRFDITTTGCSGLAYAIDYVDQAVPGDTSYHHDVDYCVSAAALPMVRGTVVDYVREGMNKKLVFSNPNAKATCGCGESFTVGEKDA